MGSSVRRLLHTTALVGLLINVSCYSLVYAQSMTDLDPFSGREYSRAQSVSGDGRIIVGTEFITKSETRAFKYVGSTLTYLNTLGGSFSSAVGVSTDGSVIVGSSSLAGDAVQHAYKLVGSSITDLGTLGGTRSGASAVSADLSVIVGFSQIAGDIARHAFKHVGSTMSDLGTLGGTNSYAYGVSANGNVIVGSSQISGDADFRAFVYSGSTMTDLGTLGGAGSSASGVSGDGSVIVGFSQISGDIAEHAFKYVGSVMIDLGTLGGTYSGANSVSADGSVIVGSSQISGDIAEHAFKYVGSTMTDLGTLGGTNSIAYGVSADGRVIVGASQISGDLAYHPFAWRSGKIIDLPETYSDLARSANNIRNNIALRASSMALMMDYDCRAFGQYNTCISFGGRYGDLNASTNEGAGVLTAAYRISPSVRIGAFIDHRVAQSKPAGINYSDDTPSGGAFIGYDRNGDGTGAQGKVTAVYNTGKVGVTRLASSANTEAGSGSSKLTSYAVGAELGWGFKLHDGWVANPYAGIRHTSSKLGAYAEPETDSVEFPISYADYGQRLSTATAGLRIEGRIADRLSIALAGGIEHELCSTMDAFVGTSAIPGLTSFSFSSNSSSNRTRGVGSAALSYQIDTNQRISGGVYMRENAYVALVTKTVLMKYEAAF